MSVTCCPLSSGDNDDEASVRVRSDRRARKVHSCTECEEQIKIGDKYEHVSACWEGSWSTLRTCLSCVEIRNHFACDGWIYGQIWEDIEDNFFPGMKAGGPCMDGLSPAAKARLFERRLRWLEATSND